MLNIIISLISGILLALSYPALNLHWMAWFSLVPLMFYINRLRWRQSVLCGFAFGFGFFAVLLYWITVFGKLPWIALAVHQALFIVLFAVIAKLSVRWIGLWGRLLLYPALWVSIEWLRTLGILGFTWGDIGYSQYKVIPVIQIASITGIWGVSFLIVLVNTTLSNLVIAFHNPYHRRVAGIQILSVSLIVLSVIVYGLDNADNQTDSMGRMIKAAIIQGNIDQDTEEDAAFYDQSWDTYTSLTQQATVDGVDLVVWPETVVPGYISQTYVRERLQDLASESKSYILAGAWDSDNLDKSFNSAVLISPDKRLLGRYAKVHLVPFGEFVPARKYLPFLKYYRVTPHDTSPGEGYNVLDTGLYKIGTAICFESIFPEISRRLTASGAEILCIITNDCWYDETAAAEQHMAMSVFRAVENRRYVLRGATTGISCAIDPAGRVLVNSSTQKRAVVKSSVMTLDNRTFYTVYGDWLVYISLLITLIIGSTSAIRRIKYPFKEKV
ncbi:MAG: apolipoprotein N-acyltransferase [Armatimonadota bacterium]